MSFSAAQHPTVILRNFLILLVADKKRHFLSLLLIPPLKIVTSFMNGPIGGFRTFFNKVLPFIEADIEFAGEGGCGLKLIYTVRLYLISSLGIW